MENTIKINIECGGTPRNGYINTTSSAEAIQRISEDSGDDIDIVLSEYGVAHEVHKDKKVSEAIVNFYMNVMTLQEIGTFLTNWTSRLMVGGLLKMKFVDTRQACRAGAFGTASLQTLHNLFLGPEGQPFSSLSDFESIKHSFENSLLKITYAKNDGYEIYIEVEKQNENTN